MILVALHVGSYNIADGGYPTTPDNAGGQLGRLGELRVLSEGT